MVKRIVRVHHGESWICLFDARKQKNRLFQMVAPSGDLPWYNPSQVTKKNTRKVFMLLKTSLESVLGDFEEEIPLECQEWWLIILNTVRPCFPQQDMGA